MLSFPSPHSQSKGLAAQQSLSPHSPGSRKGPRVLQAVQDCKQDSRLSLGAVVPPRHCKRVIHLSWKKGLFRAGGHGREASTAC